MSAKKIACYFHPTKIVLIDDQEDYLDNLVLKISKESEIVPFVDVVKAKDFLESQENKEDILNELLSSLKDREDIGELERDDMSHAYTAINVSNIHKIIYDAKRFNQVIVVIVDYAMPKMNGIKLCQALKESPFKFILLTGKATPEVVIKSFHDRVIHGFISKESPDFYEELQDAISSLQEITFQDRSLSIIKSLEKSPNSCLSDPLFSEFFNHFCHENKIAEYYLINESGSYLLLDLQGNPSILAVKNEKEIQEYAEIAHDHKELDASVAGALKAREKLLFFFTPEDEQHVAGWVDYIYPATKLSGKDGAYYYSHITNADKYDIDKTKIVSYQNYLSKL